VSARKYPGLGDIVAAVAQPVAKVIDRVAHTNLANCAGCKRRQEWLNSLDPARPND
jgi:hypothetical protein